MKTKKWNNNENQGKEHQKRPINGTPRKTKKGRPRKGTTRKVKANEDHRN